MHGPYCCRSCASDVDKFRVMWTCPECGDKRCPKAENHVNPCQGKKRPIHGASPFGALAFLPGVVDVARAHGYALTVHGSLARDFDFVAIPWTEDARPAEELAEAIRARVGGFVHPPEEFPRHKPHGRLAWSIHLGSGPYIDLSVMPRVP